MATLPHRLRARQRLGQYRIDRHLGTGGFASVYAATDTIAEVRVALKVLHPSTVPGTAKRIAEEQLSDLKREVRMASKLDHPNVLPIRTAGFVEDRLVIVTPLGLESLDDRLGRRLGAPMAVSILGQVLAGVAHAHERNVVHCDIKPENVVLFRGSGRVNGSAPVAKIADFGIARMARKNDRASGSGTVGYMAPDQALGRPSMRSDVFSVGLLGFRMLAGKLPEWPFEPPWPGRERLRRNVHSDVVAWLERAIQVNDRKRFASCVPMLREWKRIARRAVRAPGGAR